MRDALFVLANVLLATVLVDLARLSPLMPVSPLAPPAAFPSLKQTTVMLQSQTGLRTHHTPAAVQVNLPSSLPGKPVG